MRNIETAKLILSDYLNCIGKPCRQTNTNREIIEKTRIACDWPAQVTDIDSYTMKMVIISLSNIIDDFGKLDKSLFQSCLIQHCKPAKKKTKKKKPTPLNQDRMWREVRYKALKNGSGKCCLCGASPKDGIKLHVDHIKPKSLYPHLTYDVNNLQVLCEDCNIGKSNKDDTDWR